MENKEILEAIENKFAELKDQNKESKDERLKDFETALTDIKENSASKEQIEKLSTVFDKLAEDVQKLSESGTPEVKENELEKAIKERALHLKENNDRPQNFKAVGTMTFGASVTGTIPQADRESALNDLNKRFFTIRNLAAVGSTTANVVEWVYKTGKEGSAGMTGEGLAKTQQDWEYVVASANVKKITSYIKISKEMLDDIQGIMSDINNELSYEIDFLEETQLITGDGTGVNLNGIEAYAQPLDNAGLAGTIAAPNRWDVISAAITQVSVETEGRANANAILMNPVDIFAMVHGSRTTTDEYNAPMAVVEPNGTRIYGLPVIPSNSITAGEFLVGDFRKFQIKDREQLSVAMGYENDDWTKNLVTILAEKRLVSYVRNNDVDAFVTDTFADGITFLTTP